MKRVQIVFNKGCINYTGVEQVSVFPDVGKMSVVLHTNYVVKQYRYGDETDDPVNIYNTSLTPFVHTFSLTCVHKMYVEE